MQPNEPLESKIEELDDWITDSPRQFRLLAENPPPRPYGYLDQLRVDICEWKCVVYWLLGFCFIGFAFISEEWEFAVFGLMMLLGYIWVLHSVVNTCRNAPLGIGLVENLKKRHKLLADHSMAQAELIDGETVEVSVRTRDIAAILETEGRAEVLLLYKPTQEYSMVIGVRAIQCS